MESPNIIWEIYLLAYNFQDIQRHDKNLFRDQNFSLNIGNFMGIEKF